MPEILQIMLVVYGTLASIVAVLIFILWRIDVAQRRRRARQDARLNKAIRREREAEAFWDVVDQKERDDRIFEEVDRFAAGGW